MALYKQLDWWSITEMVDEIMEGRGNRCFRNTPDIMTNFW